MQLVVTPCISIATSLVKVSEDAFLFLLRCDAISGEIIVLKVIDIYLVGEKFVDTLSSKGV